ncbi:hypothetical protein K2W90_06955 [Candidatus Babeliales bacterium]|nr:hypothetical protein [Candidatus Babeliales bacterium]
MKKRLIFVPIYLGIFFSIIAVNLGAQVTFGSKQSAFNIATGARLNVGSSNLSVDGTIREETSSSISGNTFTFNDGILDVGGVELAVNATFDPTAGDTINLNGGDRVRVEPGTVLKTVAVSGAGNVLEGQPTFSSAISLAGVGTDLTVALQNTLNVDINLNGGTLILGDNLALNSDVKINGPGIVMTNGRRLDFGSFYSTPWSTALTFLNSTGLFLHGTIQVAAVWTFSGTNLLNGNGSIFEFGPGGQISIGAGNELFVNDIYIKNIGTGDFAFGSATSKLHFNNAILDIDTNLTTNVGNVVIDGHTTFVLRDKKWTFNGTGKLSIFDSLWLDVCSFTLLPMMPPAGNVFAPLAIFDGDGDLNKPNVQSNIVAGNLEISGNGNIKEVADRSLVGLSDAAEELLSGDVDMDVTLDGNVEVPADMPIVITGDVTIDGQGCAIIFCNTSNPQFIVKPGKTVKLQNITLERINANTFLLGDNSKIVIGDDVNWELIEDVTLSNGLIDVLANKMWHVTGIGGQRKLILSPASPGTTELVHLGRRASLVLKSIELQGLEFMTFEASSSISMIGESAVGIREDSAMNFDIEGTFNSIILLTDGVTLSGTIAFLGNALKNMLTIKFSLSTPVEDKVGVAPGNPLLILAGDPGLYLTSDDYLAILNLDDNTISIQNNNTNAFIVDQNSVLAGNRLEVLTNPIKKSSLLFTLKVTEITGQGIDASFARSLRPAVPRKKMPKSAFVQKRARERALKKEREQAKPPVLANKPKAMARPIAKPGRRKKQTRDLYGLDVFESRALDLPPGDNDSERYDIQYEDTRVDLAVPLQGSISLNNAILANFFNLPSLTDSTDLPFNLVLKGNSTVIQRDDQEVSLKEGTHIINVIGRNNEIQITNTFRVGKNTLFFDEDASLKFFINQNQTVIFEQDVQIDIENNSVLEFCGGGTVQLSDGVIINLNGQRAVVLPTTNCPDPVTPEVASRAYILLSEDVIVTFANNSDVLLRNKKANNKAKAASNVRRGRMALRSPSISTHIQGIGEIQVDNSCLCPDFGGFLHVAADPLNDITFKVVGSGELKVKGNSGFSIGKGCSSLTFDRDGKLTVIDGSFEINSDNKEPQRGCVDKLWFCSGTTLYVAENGLLVLGQNEVQGQYQLIEKEFNFKFQPIHIIGDGFVEFVGRDTAPQRNFIGKLQVPPFNAFVDEHMTFDKLAGFLTQTVQGLQFSTVYVDQDGNTFVRITKTGISVLLKEGDRIVGDEKRTINNKIKVVVTGRDKANKVFVIDEDGNRS